MADHHIGSFDWVACRECIHCDDLEGGCAVDVDVWESNLKPKYDYIYCGSFESRLGNSPESAGPADVQ